MSGARVDQRRAVAFVTVCAFGMGVLGVPVAGAASAQQGQASGSGQSSLMIDHDPLNCVVTELAPTVDAKVAPVPQFEKGYVYFKAAGTEDFYYTPMRGQAESLEGVLPRPLPETKAIDYKLRARDVSALAKETREYVPPVVPGSACKAKGTAVGPEGAGLTIGLTKEGQSPVPPGFNKKDIAFVILVSGATVSLAAALGGAGGSGGAASGATAAKAGGSKGLLIAGGVVVAGGAAIAIASSNKGTSNTATPVPTATPTPTSTPTPTVAFAFVEADATWSGMGDVEVQILNASGGAVGTVLPAGCESTAQRTERVLLQGPPAGTYRVMLSAKTCGSGTPASIATVVSVQSSGQPKCPNTFVNVPVGGSVTGCTFTMP
jgi:hypothetical protein